MTSGFSIVNAGFMAYAAKMQKKRTDFGERMLKARKNANLTQLEVHDALGIAQSTLSHLEVAARGSAHTVEFARLYNVSPEWLSSGFGDLDDPPSDLSATALVAGVLCKATKEDRAIWLATILRDMRRSDAFTPSDIARFEAAIRVFESDADSA